MMYVELFAYNDYEPRARWMISFSDLIEDAIELGRGGPLLGGIRDGLRELIARLETVMTVEAEKARKDGDAKRPLDHVPLRGNTED
jgi:hypothetical protein